MPAIESPVDVRSLYPAVLDKARVLAELEARAKAVAEGRAEPSEGLIEEIEIAREAAG